MKLHQYLELSGLALLLLAFCWEYFAVNYNNAIISSEQFEHIAKRLDEIHERQFELQKVLNAVGDQITSHQPAGAYYVQKFKYNTSYASFVPELEKRNKSYDNVRVIIFILGSLLLLLGKAIEFSFDSQDSGT